ncbi:hypothetical protein FUAX_51920 (plasmid) [Fulvitalea axinellae]|uniref:beta-N-acetylhexosaminidase n=1 Tax=Fulvitalea axinellae TaxID=1182444 RepID=A0AAU9DNJ1_9BACT|nr:hypothetical protein FUAX_51920 [Fulvitalea axinellae]
MRMSFKTWAATLFFLCWLNVVWANVPIVPQPLEYQLTEGTLKLRPGFKLYADPAFKEIHPLLKSSLEEHLGFSLRSAKANAQKKVIAFTVDPALGKLGEEGYAIKITKSRVLVSASHRKGAFYGLQSLLQLIDASEGQYLACAEIFDKPRFSWRAYMLDEARFFKGMNEVKLLLDEMAFLKMNVFHWHLVDNEGWRIEIKKYPKLTKVGGTRKNSQIGPKKWNSPKRTDEPHSGFYTQEQIKEVVEYARLRNITVVPEIGMPGHSSAAVASYTWLGTLGKDIEVPDSFRCDDIFDITKPEVYNFLTDVLDEVMELFPSKVIHIGGDEVDFKIWDKSKSIKKFMKKKGINTLPDLQIYFTNKIGNYLQSKGRRLMGWNEVMGHQVDDRLYDEKVAVEGELAKNAVVHFWKGDKKLFLQAVEKGHDVVNSTNGYTYLDYSHSSIPLKKAFHFDPIPKNLDKAYHKNIIGMGCQMWGEWIPTSGDLHYMTFPRIAAYASVGWTDPARKDYDRFRSNLSRLAKRWKHKGLNMAPWDVSDPAPARKAPPKFDIAHAPAPLFRDPVFDGPADPSLIWVPKYKEWWMFYTQRRASAAFDNVAYCYGSAIGLAKSRDNGRSWTYAGVAKLPQPDSGHNTFWAPQVVFDRKTGDYHMFVTYIKGVRSNWGGAKQILHYSSKDMETWKAEKPIGTEECIDASVIRLEDGSWKMWYKDEANGSKTVSALSSDLKSWKLEGTSEISRNAHEGPVVFHWKGKYWMLTDKWNGLDCYVSDDATNWEPNNTILTKPGARPDDNVMGRHADVKIVNDRAYVFYFTHPGRRYNKSGQEIPESGTINYQRTSIQVAELEIINGKLTCDRDKYLRKSPHQ